MYAWSLKGDTHIFILVFSSVLLCLLHIASLFSHVFSYFWLQIFFILLGSLQKDGYECAYSSGNMNLYSILYGVLEILSEFVDI